MVNLFNLFKKKREDKSNLYTVKPLDFYLKEVLNESQFIKPNCVDYIMNNFFNTDPPTYGSAFLTKEEKKKLNINLNTKITHETLNVLTEDGKVLFSHPRKTLEWLYHKSMSRFYTNNTLYDFKEKSNYYFYKVRIIENAWCCDWCKSMSEQHVPITQDFNQLLKNNCTCFPESCSLVVLPDREHWPRYRDE